MKKNKMRQKVQEEILKIQANNILLELPTGLGKTKLALEKVSSLNAFQKVLIVVPRLVLIDSWKKEIEKWGFNLNPTFVTYVSLHKMIGDWDVVIYDECHHLSERCRENLPYINSKSNILLSATVKFKLKQELCSCFKDLYLYKVNLRTAIEEEALPDPIVYLIPLILDNKEVTESFMINEKKPGAYVNCMYATKWQFIKSKTKTKVHCTQRQYYDELSNKIDWYKNRYFRCRNKGVQAKWLQLAGERLKWLSDRKTDIVKEYLRYLKSKRVLTFCNSIEQAEKICSNNITSKNNDSQRILDSFNTGKINHITACNMLNEGMNLTNCQIGIYANLNSSETIVKQRTGRLLRHEKPIIIIPYFKNTRDEELVKLMIEDYNKDLIKIINFINEIYN